MAKEKIIIDRKVWQFHSDNNEPTEVDQTEWIERYKNQEFFVVHAGAPGIGRTVYKITKETEEGLWGIQVENTVRVLEPHECI